MIINHLAPKVTSALVVETSVTSSNSFQNFPYPDDHTTINHKYMYRRQTLSMTHQINFHQLYCKWHTQCIGLEDN